MNSIVIIYFYIMNSLDCTNISGFSQANNYRDHITGPNNTNTNIHTHYNINTENPIQISKQNIKEQQIKAKINKK